MDNNEIKRQLSSINWNFDFSIDYDANSLRPFNCRKYYSYPATFIPEIPYALIKILSKKGDVVLDPFGGIGTTFMQALSLERIPYSCDINPVASAVCKTLYYLFNPNINPAEIMEQLLQLCEGYNEQIDYSVGLSELRKGLSDWYEKNTFNAMAFLFIQLDQIQDACTREVMRLVLSSIMVSLSSQNKGWAYIADNVKPKTDELRQKPVFEQYKTATRTLLEDVIGTTERLPETFRTFYETISRSERVFDKSIMEALIEPESVDLIITSPPYPRMIDYIKSQRLSFGLFNEDFNDYMASEVGARYRRSRHDFLELYKKEINQINARLASLLKKDGFLCVVLPEYEDPDNRKPVIEDIVEQYSKLGLNRILDVGRYIPSHKRTLSIQWATLVNERIYVFQKG